MPSRVDVRALRLTLASSQGISHLLSDHLLMAPLGVKTPPGGRF